MRQLAASFLAFALLVAVGPSALADEAMTLTRNPETLSDAELDARIRFIEERLDAGRTWAWRWQWGWTATYAAGVALGTGQAAATDSGKNRADYITTAVKGVIGTTRLLLQPLPGRNGADPLRELRFGNTQDAKIQRLQKAEELLLRVKHRAEQRRSWIPHLANVGLNLVGAGFILGFGHSSDAIESFAVGVAVGEAHIWSAPWRGIQDVEDYQSRFGMKTADRFDWRIVPTLGGAQLQVTF